MKSSFSKKITRLLAFLLSISLLLFQNAGTANAKVKQDTNVKPTISQNSKTLDERGDSFELSLQNIKDNVASLYWYTTNGKIAEVKGDKNTGKATVTSLSSGTAYIKCKVTYRDKSTYETSCKITVKPKTYEKEDYEAQAKLVSLVRTDNNKLLATFDKDIQTPGLVLVNSKTECIEGKKDSSDKTKVYYTLSSDSADLTGSQKVYIGYWEGYDVAPDDTSSDKFKEVKVDFDDESNKVLPAPYSIEQSESNHNILYIHFDNKLDEDTAEDKENYSVNGGAIASAIEDVDLTTNSSGEAKVKLTLKEGAIKTSGDYVVSISGIKGYNNTYSTMKTYKKTIELTENTPPTLTSFYYSYPDKIILTFSEDITGNIDFKVKQDGDNLFSYAEIDGKKVILYLTQTPDLGDTLEIIPKEDNSIEDLAGNETDSILTRNLVPYKN